MSTRHQERGRFRPARVTVYFLLALCVLLLSGSAAFAQANAGIPGTVTDASGAVVPDANVTITNEGTSVANKTVTTGSGTYSFTGLNPGLYDVAREKSGFKKSVQNRVNVEVTVMSTINFTLANGAASETVEITANPIALNTT